MTYHASVQLINKSQNPIQIHRNTELLQATQKKLQKALQLFLLFQLLNKDKVVIQGKAAEICLGIRPFYYKMNKLITAYHEEIIKKNIEAEKNIIIIDEKPREVDPQISLKNNKQALEIHIPQNNRIIQQQQQQQQYQQLQQFNLPPLPQLSTLNPHSLYLPNSYQLYQQNEQECQLKKLIKKNKIKEKKFLSEIKVMMKSIQQKIQRNSMSVKQEYDSDEENQEQIKKKLVQQHSQQQQQQQDNN